MRHDEAADQLPFYPMWEWEWSIAQCIQLAIDFATEMDVVARVVCGVKYVSEVSSLFRESDARRAKMELG